VQGGEVASEERSLRIDPGILAAEDGSLRTEAFEALSQ